MKDAEPGRVKNASQPRVNRRSSRRGERESGVRAAREENMSRMLQVLACGAVVFPGLFFAFRKILPCVFKHWSDADVVLVSER